jgi:putative DNA primase/helicase
VRISARGGTGSHEHTQAVAQVRHCIEMHGEARFEPRVGSAQVLGSNVPERPVHNRLGWREGSGSKQLWHVTPENWKSEVCRGLDQTAVARALAESGMLVRGRKGQAFSRLIKINNATVRVYTITAAILSA